MCGRFALALHGDMIAAAMDASPVLPAFVDALAAWTPRFNIPPTSTIPVVISERTPSGGEQPVRAITFMRWGLVPSWAKDRSIGARLSNARSDSVVEKPAFRDGWKRRRCLIPATAFYEWQTPSDGSPKQPYAIASASGELLALAGIWERWIDRSGSDAVELLTVAIITTEANESLASIHDRMPVLVPQTSWDQWLTASTPPVGLLTPAPSAHVRAWPVSRHVNSVRHDDEHCLDPGG